jgi:hypothetical protein
MLEAVVVGLIQLIKVLAGTVAAVQDHQLMVIVYHPQCLAPQVLVAVAAEAVEVSQVTAEVPMAVLVL